MAHIHQAIDFVVSVYIICDNRVLLILHKKLNRWLPIGGHIELNEDPDEALFREVEEECGLMIRVLNDKPQIVANGHKSLYTPKAIDIHEFNDPKLDHRHRHIALVYYALSESAEFKLAEAEHHDIRWFSAGDLMNQSNNIGSEIKYHAKAAMVVANKIK